MAQLSKRLAMVAGMVDKGSRAADIGCDHAYTSIYLMERGIAKNVIAMDVNQGPLMQARKNVERSGYADSIELRLSDGVKELKPAEADALIISGMGGALTVRILKEGNEVVKEAAALVLQPQSEIFLVRKYLHCIGFAIDKEQMLVEDGKYYTAIHAKKGVEAYEKEIFYLYGKYLLEHKNPVLWDYLKGRIKKCEKIVNTLSRQEYDRNKKRQDELMEEISFLREACLYYCQEERLTWKR